MNSAITDHIDQIEKATWSPATVHSRLRRAIVLLPASQAAASSGFQSVIRWRAALSEALRCLWTRSGAPACIQIPLFEPSHQAVLSRGVFALLMSVWAPPKHKGNPKSQCLPCISILTLKMEVRQLHVTDIA